MSGTGMSGSILKQSREPGARTDSKIKSGEFLMHHDHSPILGSEPQGLGFGEHAQRVSGDQAFERQRAEVRQKSLGIRKDFERNLANFGKSF